MNVFGLIFFLMGGRGGGRREMSSFFSFFFCQAHSAWLLFRSITRHLSLQWTVTIVTVTQY